MFFTLKRRRFDGDRNVEVLTPVTLSTRIEHGNKAEAWLVFFRAAWSGASDNFDPVFADLSLKYGGVQRGCTRNMYKRSP